MLGIPWGDAAPWSAVGHTEAWGAAVRRRVRRIGLVAFAHGSSEAVQLRLASLRRHGWPRDGAPPELAFTARGEPAATTPRWSPIVHDADLNLPAANPYDPDSADVVAEVEGPAGERLRYPAYWHEPMRLEASPAGERVLPDGPGRWRWCFTPPTPGVWRWRLAATLRWRDRTLTATDAWRSTTVAGSTGGGVAPLRVSAADPNWFETVDGAFFYPLGLNLRSPGDDRQDGIVARLPAAEPAPMRSGSQPGGDVAPGDGISARMIRDGTGAYARWFDRMQANGLNWARVWMSPWWCGIEWNAAWDEFGGLTWYNQAAAARLDRLCDLADARGIRLQIELQNHGMTSPRVDRQWLPEGAEAGSPYAVENGGRCASPAEFFSSDWAWAAHEKRLRYTLARWGWRTGIAAWVLSSELEWTGAWEAETRRREDAHSPTTQAWVERSLAWWRTHDVLARPVTVHFSHPWRGAEMWTLPGLGFSNSNAYTGFQEAMGKLGGGEPSLPRALDRYLRQQFPPERFRRPTLIGEWGGHWHDNQPERLRQELRHGLWMQAVLPYGGNTGFWWWLVVDAGGWWDDFAPVARFQRDFDPRGRGFRQVFLRCADERVRAAAMQDAQGVVRGFAFLRGSDQRPLPALPDGGRALLPGQQPGRSWTLTFVATRTGSATPAGTLTAGPDGTLVIPLGALDPDVAFTLAPVPAANPP
jgi:hypothetical protein